MTKRPDRWHEIDALFDAALDLPAEERAGFISDACGDDTVLRQAVEDLLSASAESDAYFQDSGEALVARVHERLGLDTALEGEEDESLQRVGSYRLIEKIGRGGMGSVFLAERDDGEFEQRVAIKVLRRGLDTEDVVRRFRAERQILASLAHPNIARLLDGGSTTDGRPYLVMEHVEGQRITDYCDARSLSIPERIELFETVLRAVHHAHTHLVIHRDIKASNIYVTDSGRVKLLDFGIAKLVGDGVDAGALTVTGVRLLTPGYASPEQLIDEPVTTASDVFQLGLLLYELLTGLRPFGDSDTSPGEYGRRTLEGALERPGRRIRRLAREAEAGGPDVVELASRRGLSADRLSRMLAGDLNDVVSMALRREASERYQSAEQFASDLERFRASEPVVASSGAVRYRVRRFVRRHRWALAAAGVLLIMVAGYVMTLNAQSHRILEERDRAQASAVQAEQITAFMTSVFGGADPSQTLGETVTARELLERGVARVDTELADQPRLQSEMLMALGNVYSQLGSYEAAVDLIERAIALRRAESDGDPAKLAGALASLGATHRTQRDFPFAEEPLREALEIQTGVHGRDDPRTAETMMNLAMTLRDLGRADTAVALMYEVVEIYRRDPGEQSYTFVRSLTDLAYTLRAADRLDEAEALNREALPTLRALHGEGNASVLPSTLNNLAYIVRRRGAYEEAASLYAEAVDLMTDIYGRGHPTTLMMAGNLLSVRAQNLDDYAGAVDVERESILAAESQWPDGHWRVGSEYRALGILLLHLNDLVAADSALTRAVLIFDEQIGPLHSWTARAMAWLATSYHLQGRVAAADRLFEDAHETLLPMASDDGIPASDVAEIERFAAFLEERGLNQRAAQFLSLIR